MTGQDLSLASKARWNATAVAVGSLSRLLAGIVIARQLGPDQNGQFAFLLWLAESLVLVFSVGLPGALNRFLALKMGQGEQANAQRIMRFSLRAGLVLSLFAALAAYGLALHLLSAGTETTEMAVTLALLVAAQLWSGLAQAILTGLQHFRAYARVVAVSSLILLAGQIVGAMGWGLHGAIYGALASYTVSAVFFLISIAQTSLWKASLAASGSTSVGSSIAAYARDAWLAGLISAVVWGRAELFVLDRLSTGREAGYFAAGLVFSSLVVQAVNLVSGALLPHLSCIVGEGQTARLHNDYRRMTVFIALLAFPLALGGVALMPEIVKLVFGAAYAEATPAAQWLMATGMLTFATVGSSVLYGYGDAHIIRNWSVLGACLLVLLCTLLAPTAGAAGVAAARFLVQTLLIGIGFYLLRKRYVLPIPLRALGMLLVAAICCGAASNLASELVGGGAVGILLGIVCGATIYALMLRLLGVVSIEDAATLGKLFAQFPSALSKPANTLLTLVCPR
jgi:O-antigen/teichoic acid export membrane protein